MPSMRWVELGMPSCCRYFATVRREMSQPLAFMQAHSASSDRGWARSSPATSSRRSAQAEPAHLQDLQTLELLCRKLLLLFDLYLQNAASFPVDLTNSIAQKWPKGKPSGQHGHAEAAAGHTGTRFCV